MAQIFKSKKLKSLLPYFLLAVAIIIAYKIINELGFFVSLIAQICYIAAPFFYGFILAYIINIPCSFIQNLLDDSKIGFIVKKKKVLSIILVFLIIVLAITLVLNLIVPAISSSISYFVVSFPIYYENTLQFVEYVNSLEIFGISINIDAIINLFRDMIQNIGFDHLTSSISALLVVSSAIFRSFLAIISSIYFVIEKDRFKSYLLRLLKAFTSTEIYLEVIEYAAKINNNFRQYIKAQTIDGVILGITATIALYILGSPYALILGLMLGIVNYIPYFGSIFGSLVAIIIIAFTQGVTSAVIAAITLLIIQQIDANIIQPRLMAGSFSLSPLLVIVSISFGGAAAGLLGMIVAIPLVALLKDIVESIITHYENKSAE